MTDVVKPALPDEDDVLAYTHQQRLHMLGQVLAQGKLPEDPSMAKVAVSLLKDMDAAALGRKRIKVDEKIADTQEQAAGVIAKVLGAAALHKPYRIADAKDITPRPAPTLGSEIPPPRLVEGEMDEVTSHESYESFVARTDALNAGSSTH